MLPLDGSTTKIPQEVKLSTSSAERDLYESLAEIYSILVTLDALEKAYLKDSIIETEYTEICSRLLNQYKSNLADETVLKAFGDLEAFKRTWSVSAPSSIMVQRLSSDMSLQVECPRATERLKIGLPATVEQTSHKSVPQGGGAAATLIVSASENFITVLDAIKIGMVSKDTLHPILVETIQAVNKVTSEFQGKEKIVQWLITLNQMRAVEELNEEQAREFQFDMESAYYGFKRTL